MYSQAKPKRLRSSFGCLLLAGISLSAGGQSSETEVSALEGQYKVSGEAGVLWSISSDGGRLYLESSRMPKHPLTRISTMQFKDGGLQYVFMRGKDPASLTVTVTGARTLEAVHAERIDAKPIHYTFPVYSRREVMIPMRDGVKLHTVILRPEKQEAPLPFLLIRTPYGVDGNTSDSVNARYTELAKSGYIFAMQDIRGRYGSEGVFDMVRPLADHRNPSLVDESTDAYDTAAWITQNIDGNNGRIGVFGISYPGFTAMEAGIDHHPAVKVISPQAPAIDMWMGDDFFHNGAFRETYGYDYVLRMEKSKEQSSVQIDEDTYNYFLRAGSFEEAAKLSGLDNLPTGRAFIEHPAFDEFWQARAVERKIAKAEVPTLLVSGYWDQEDMWGPQEAYAKGEANDPSSENFLVIGPWNHGQWSASTQHLGQIDFGSNTTDYFRQSIEAPFFSHYLKDEGDAHIGDTTTYQTGSNEWKSYSRWPPPESRPVSLYLHCDGKANFSASHRKSGEPFVSYISDPADPVPYRKRPIESTYDRRGSGWFNWMVQDQRFLSGRLDLANWTTGPLERDVIVTGEVFADIFASTRGSDSDWVVKLIDVYPSAPGQDKMAGFQLMINAEIFRGRYLSGFDHPAPLKAGAIDEYKFSLHAADHAFLKGHRIMVQIQSTWFPLYDRNPQKYVFNIMRAKPEDFQRVEQRIYCSAQHPSHIILPMRHLPSDSTSDSIHKSE